MTSLIPGGSAESSGLINVGDRILTVDGADISGLAVPDVVKLIVGKAGTAVTLGILSRVPDAKLTASAGSGQATAPAPAAATAAPPGDDVDAVERKYKVSFPRRRSCGALGWSALSVMIEEICTYSNQLLLLRRLRRSWQ